MAYRFKPEESFAKGAARILAEQADEAAARLSSGADREKAVHEARKCMKRARALLRLAKPVIPASDFARENARYRDIARMLAGQRDADVLRVTLQSFEGKGGSKMVARVASALDHRLPAHADTNHADAPDRFADPRAALAKAREAAFEIPFPDAPIASSAFDGVMTTYKKGRRDWRELSGAPDHEEAWHEWRKYLQAHWRQMMLLSAAWPDWFKARAELANKLSDVLGEDHDLYVLKGHVAGLPASNGTRGGIAASDRRRMTAMIEKRQEELRAKALQLGDRLYSRTPKRLVEEIRDYWRLASAKPRERRKARNLRSAARS